MRKFIERVTITGADDTIKPEDLLRISKKFNFVEWGILLSKNSSKQILPSPRFGSDKWVRHLYMLAAAQHSTGTPMNLSAHLCGSYVTDITKGRWTIFDKYKFEMEMFNRIQLNFHGQPHLIDPYNFIAGFNDNKLNGKQIIFQLDGMNDDKLSLAKTQAATNVSYVGLFDMSHGAGVLPDKWPSSNEYCGYAGGLSPDNIVENLSMISEVTTANAWVDFETHARTFSLGFNRHYDEFDLNKCVDFLEKCEPYMVQND